MILDRQIDAFVATGLHRLASLTEPTFRQLFEPLRATASVLPQVADPVTGTLPYVPVITDALIDPAARVPGLRLANSTREGILDRNHGEEGLAPYTPVPSLALPDAPVYLLVDVERGDEFRNVAPREALPVITTRGRTPLTIAEGLSIQAAHPDFMFKNHCYMLAGSSRGDKRVPALWISDKSPKLGWCFQGVPHTWLGIATAGAREAGAA